LLKRGWPASALLLTVVRARFSPEGHTVLTVRTSKGDLVLDSRSRRVKDWMRTPYRYYARQSQSATGKWDRIAR
jgi:predicted transglutaminase-like cysteine proteinase